MPRAARAKSSTGVYHVMLRGINRQVIFTDCEDNEKFLQTIADCNKWSSYNDYIHKKGIVYYGFALEMIGESQYKAFMSEERNDKCLDKRSRGTVPLLQRSKGTVPLLHEKCEFVEFLQMPPKVYIPAPAFRIK